jgi:hypothetical protein
LRQQVTGGQHALQPVISQVDQTGRRALTSNLAWPATPRYRSRRSPVRERPSGQAGDQVTDHIGEYRTSSLEQRSYRT